MNYYLILRPIIGAGIGYITNWIAVKMLFRPLNPIKIGKFTLPFTPGLIPKNKNRIAIAIGNSISNNLLTESTLRDNLLSEEKKQLIKEKINSYSQQSGIELKEFLSSYIDTNTLNDIENRVSENLSNSIYNSLKESNISNTISNQFYIVASEKLKGSLLGVFGGNSIISSMVPEIESKIDNYIDTDGKILITQLVNQELSKIESKTTSDIMSEMNSNFDISNIIITLYENIVINKLPNLLENINISKIVSDKINSMPTLELEKLILEIMKKELSALVNLGALIGFVLGLLNLLF